MTAKRLSLLALLLGVALATCVERGTPVRAALTPRPDQPSLF
jgi:hypothetical protein